MGTPVLGTNSGESVILPFGFRQSLVIKGCHSIEGDEDT